MSIAPHLFIPPALAGRADAPEFLLGSAPEGSLADEIAAVGLRQHSPDDFRIEAVRALKRLWREQKRVTSLAAASRRLCGAPAVKAKAAPASDRPTGPGGAAARPLSVLKRCHAQNAQLATNRARRDEEPGAASDKASTRILAAQAGATGRKSTDGRRAADVSETNATWTRTFARLGWKN